MTSLLRVSFSFSSRIEHIFQILYVCFWNMMYFGMDVCNNAVSCPGGPSDAESGVSNEESMCLIGAEK